MYSQDSIEQRLILLVNEYYQLGIDKQINYDKFYLYSLVTHSTSIEGSTITELENQIMFDEGLSLKGKSLVEQFMNLDLKAAYEQSKIWAAEHQPITLDLLKKLASLVMKNTGQSYNTALGSFPSTNGDFRLLNVTAGVGGKSYMNYSKVPDKLNSLCSWVNELRENVYHLSLIDKYNATFDAHYELVTIHPWADGNGRMARLLMNHLQFEFGLIPTIIHKEDKSEYIKSLVNTRESDDYSYFRSFMIQNMVNNLQEDIHNYKISVFTEKNTSSPKITDPQLFYSSTGYKIACRIEGERQLGIFLSEDDCHRWDNLQKTATQEEKEQFKLEMAKKYFSSNNDLDLSERKNLKML